MIKKEDKNNSPESEIAKKRTILSAVIVIFMVALVAIWAFNVRSFVKLPTPKAQDPNNQVRWDDISRKFNNTMDDIGQKISELTAKQEESRQVDALGNRLKNLADNLETQYSSASSTASSTATSTATSSATSTAEMDIRDNLKQLEDKLHKLN